MRLYIASLLILSFFLSLPLQAFEEGEYTREILIDVEYIQNRTASIQASFLIERPVEDFVKLFNEADTMSDYIPRLLYNRIIGERAAQAVIGSQEDSFDKILQILEGTAVDSDKKFIPTSGDKNNFYMLQRYDLPWPAKNRWLLLKCEQDHTLQKRYFFRPHKMVAGTLKREEGSWSAQTSRQNPQWTWVTYQTTSEPGFQVPNFIGRMGAKKSTRQMLEAIRQEVEKPQL